MVVLAAPPLGRHAGRVNTDELRRAAISVVGDDARGAGVVGAFVAVSGPHPGLLPLSPLPFVLLLLTTGSTAWSITVLSTVWVGLFLATRQFVVAWNADEVFVMRATRWRARPVEVVGRLPLAAALLAAEGTRRAVDPLLEPAIVIGGASYWLSSSHSDEAGRLRQAWRAARVAADAPVV